MHRDALRATLHDYGLSTPQAYMAEAFSRNIGFLSQAEQQELAHATVAIPGMGGVGGVHLMTLVRTGVGRFHLADFDTYEPANINRQFGASVPAFGRSKLDVMVEHAISVNPYLEIATFPTGIDSSNIDAFLDGVDVVLDGIDFFAFEARRLLFNRAREKGIYVVTAAPLGFSAAVLVFAPHTGMSFDEYFHIVEGMSPAEHYLAFAVGLAPRPTHLPYLDRSRVNLGARTGPSLSIACQLCSGMAATEALRILLHRPGLKPVPHYVQFDAYRQTYRQGRLVMGNRNPLQRLKMRLVQRLLQGQQPSPLPLPAPPVPPVQPAEGPVAPATLDYLLQAGTRAPSGDNAQPWRFDVQGQTIALCLDRQADTSFFNVQQYASLIACGAVLHNIRLAATAVGVHTEVTYLPTSADADLLASITCTPAPVAADPLAEAVWTRHTNRTWYATRPLPRRTLAALQDCVSPVPDARVHLLTQATDLAALARLLYKADRIRTEHRALHEHLHRMLRSSPADALARGDGLPLPTLEAGRAGELFLRSTRPWWMMQLANRLGIGRMVPLHALQSMRHASAAMLVTVAGLQPGDFLRGGEAMQRLWLTLTAHGLAVQPMAALTLFRLRTQLEGDAAFAPTHRRLLQAIWPVYARLFPDACDDGQGHVMLLRVGYGRAVQHYTPRKALEAVCTPRR